ARLAKQLNDSLAKPPDFATKLIIESTANNVALRESTISNDLALEQQQLALAQSVEFAQIVGPQSKAVKTTARSRRNSVVVGALIGLLLGAIAAIVADPRLPRPRA